MKKTILALTFLTVALIGKIVTPVKLDMQTNNAVQEIVQPQIDKKLSKANLAAASRSASGPNYGSEQSTLWTPVTQIEDGAVYTIRSAQNPNLVWDLTNGSLSNGTKVQLYNINYTHAQKFYVRKQFDVNGYTTYRFSPLYNYDKILRVTSKSENANVQIADETYTDLHLYSDKFAIIPIHPSIPTQFAITSCVKEDTGMKVSVNSLASGQKLVNKTHSNYVSNMVTTWEFLKTDYVGLNLANKTWVEGTSDFRYVARVPRLGRYVIETYDYYDQQVDTFLALKRDSDGVVVATNDDGGQGYNAKIVYNFQTQEEFSIFVRGYNDDTHGYCYLVFRPEKTLYLTGTYDYDNQKYDRVNPLNKCKENLRQMGYFAEVQANFNHNSVYSETDWEGNLKIERDYYVFIGHGGNAGRYSVYFDAKYPDWVNYNEIPSIPNAGLMLWMTCQGANEEGDTSGHCFAMAAAMQGAAYSLGFKEDIDRVKANNFVIEFFKARVTNGRTDSIVIAARKSGLKKPVVFSNGGHTETRYTVTSSSYSTVVVYHSF